jgi:hypothetical protein
LFDASLIERETPTLPESVVRYIKITPVKKTAIMSSAARLDPIESD